MHPQSDGMVERLNRTLEDVLSKFVSNHQRDWDQHIPLALMAYRSSVHESTGFSPSMLMFGREIELPIDLLYGPHPEKQGNLIGSEGSYLWNLTQTLWSIHNIAREKMKQASDRQKRQYDHKICARQYRVGDPVWVFNPTKTKGRSPKLQCQWMGPYYIAEVYTDLIYKIKRSSESKENIIHHDRLKPYFGKCKHWRQEGTKDLPSTSKSLEPEKERENTCNKQDNRRSTRQRRAPEYFES